MTTPEAIIAAVRSRGSDADDLRDAAHEAYHALRAGVRPGRWGRESIHRAILRGKRSGFLSPRHDLASHEIGARAVEQIVCARFSVHCGAIESWAHISWMEAHKSRVLMFPPDGWIAERVREWMTKPRIIAAADEIIALKLYAPRRARSAS